MNNLNVLVEIANINGHNHPKKYWVEKNSDNLLFIIEDDKETLLFVTYSMSRVTNEYKVDEQRYMRRKSS